MIPLIKQCRLKILIMEQVLKFGGGAHALIYNFIFVSIGAFGYWDGFVEDTPRIILLHYLRKPSHGRQF